MQLIYRARTFDYTPRPVLPYVKPRALNWRFQLIADFHTNSQ